MTRHLGIRKWRTLAMLFVVAAAAATADKIPLNSGGVVDREVLGHTKNGIVVRTPKGATEIRWRYISRSYPKHPQHETARTPGARAADFGMVTKGV